ncbi:MAG: hypothetical protein ACOVP4_09635 [Bacteriovoracaceae bacterium]
MAYVIVTTRPQELKGVFAPHSFLSEAQWCTERGILSTILPALEGEFSFILVDFDNIDFFVDQLSQVKKKDEFKLIYFCQEYDGKTLRAHQKSALSGDAYLPFSISTTDLEQVLLALTPQEMNLKGNRLESDNKHILKMYDLEGLGPLDEWKKSFASQNLDEAFESIMAQKPKIKFQSVSSFAPVDENDEVGDEVNLSEDDVMSDKDQDLSLDELGDLEIGGDESLAAAEVDEGGFDLSLDEGEELNLSAEGEVADVAIDSADDFNLDDGMDLDLSADTYDTLSLSEDEEMDDKLSLIEEDEGLAVEDNLGELDLGEIPDLGDEVATSDEAMDFSLGEESADTPDLPPMDEADLGAGLDLGGEEELSFGADESSPSVESDLSDDALAKLKEIDEMMGDPADQSLVSDDIDLGQIDLSGDDDILASLEPEVKKAPKKKKEAEVETTVQAAKSSDQDIKQIVGNYSGEMERLAATLSNLRADREELLAKIQKLEEDKILQQRQNLSLRAELDEKKIELTIIKKKLNEENNELKDKLKIQEEMKLIWEERNRQLQAEVEKISHKTRLDVKKVQGRERELEQKLELLKADAETQIRHRDQKILELKRRVDGMEFDMESMGHQEKKSLEGKVELEQKLDKAIRTLRGAISILENDSEAAKVLEKLKKNIEV